MTILKQRLVLQQLMIRSDSNEWTFIHLLLKVEGDYLLYILGQRYGCIQSSIKDRLRLFSMIFAPNKQRPVILTSIESMDCKPLGFGLHRSGLHN